MQEWRWDQGRILYFQYDVLREIARVLIRFNGKNVNDNDIASAFKECLIQNTGMPFLPVNYKVNRNYSRVFQCAMLATTGGKGVLEVSDICKELASDNSRFESADDYLFEVVNRFRYPYPAFQEYNNSDERIYPFCTILKFLIAKKLKGEEAFISLEDIASYIIGNNCTGLEDISFYENLKKTSYSVTGDNLRQLREIIVFIGQLSFIKIFNRKVYLDVLSQADALMILDKLLRPVKKEPYADRVEEFLSMTQLENKIFIPSYIRNSDALFSSGDSADIEFVEGKRKRVYHLRIERSPILRKIYIQHHPEPICDACKMHIQTKYPWVDYMLDLHHLLPLSSVVRTTIDFGTSLSDMVGLCPSCHRAIHSYYSKWLKANNKEDFESKKEAMNVYLDAIKEIA